MPVTLFEAGVRREQEESTRPAVVAGTVINNCDLIGHGKVLVRIPSLDKEIWARIAAIGAGSSRGNLYIPEPDDEVLVALNHDDPNDGFVVGGTWNTSDRPPVSDPIQLLTKRVIKTGKRGGLGHEVEFDDLQQKITITSSTQQKIAIDPTTIEISTTGGTAKISMDVAGNITIQAALSLTLKATQIKIEGAQVEINGAATTDVKSTGVCSINAPLVKIN